MDPWNRYRRHGSINPNTQASINIHQRWNKQHIKQWLDKDTPITHDLSPISHFPRNSTAGLAVTKNGSLIFGRNDNMAFVITSCDDADFQLVICKYRFIYDIYLLYQSEGYAVAEYPIDSCPACLTIPASKEVCRAHGPVKSENLTAQNEDQDALTPAQYFQRIASSGHNPSPRRRSTSEKRHKHKAALFRQHPLQHGRASRLQRLVAHKRKDKQRWRGIQQDRKLKQWNMQVLSCPHSTWLDYVPEEDLRIDWRDDYHDMDSYYEGNGYGGTAAMWAGWAAEHAETWHEEFGQWMLEDGEEEDDQEEDEEESVPDPFEEFDGEEGYFSILGL
jgi:hypothetical protein